MTEQPKPKLIIPSMEEILAFQKAEAYAETEPYMHALLTVLEEARGLVCTFPQQPIRASYLLNSAEDLDTQRLASLLSVRARELIHLDFSFELTLTKEKSVLSREGLLVGRRFTLTLDVTPTLAAAALASRGGVQPSDE